MTTYQPTSNSNTPIRMVAGDTAIIDQGITLSTPGDQAIQDFSFGFAQIFGTVEGDGGVTFGGAHAFTVVTIANTGLVKARGSGVQLGYGNARLTNAGTIVTTSAIGTTDNGVMGELDGFPGSVQYITNSGSISAVTGVLLGGQGNEQVINSGTISGSLAAISSVDGPTKVSIQNTGHLNGDVDLTNAITTVLDSSSGIITGTISTGGGASSIKMGLTGGTVDGGTGNDAVQANQSQVAANDAAHFIMDGGQGSNSLYGGGAFNTFRAGDNVGSHAGINALRGGQSMMTNVSGYHNNTVDFSETSSSQSVYVDLLDGHNAYLYAGANHTGALILEDSIQNIPNVIGSNSGDVIRADNAGDTIQGGGGADILKAGGGADTFVYKGYGDSNIPGGHDVISGFQTGVDKVDLSALNLTANHLVIKSNATSTSLYDEQVAGHFNASTDLAISFIGAHAIRGSDVIV